MLAKHTFRGDAGTFSAMTVAMGVGAVVGGEKFTGNVQQGMNGTGTMEIQGDVGTKCIGHYVARSAIGGDGSLTCNDGRQAMIQYTTTTSVGVGYGYGITDAGVDVRFYFGMEADQGVQYIAATPEQPGSAKGGYST